VFAMLGLSLAACSCSRNKSKNSLAPGPAMSRFIHFELAIYLPSTHSAAGLQPIRALTESLRNYPDLKLVANVPEQPQRMFVCAHVDEHVKDNYAPPSMNSLKYSGRGLTSKQAEALQKSTHALILQFAHPQEDVWIGLRTAAELVNEVVAKTDGFVWDEETREVFTPEAWRERRIAQWTEPPRVSLQTIIHEYNTGHSVRAITLGMEKMGLPDLVVEDSGWSSGSEIGNLINLVGQALAEGQPLTKSGEFRLVLPQIHNAGERNEMVKSLKANAATVGCLTLIPGRWEDGDPHNTLVQLTFDKYPGSDAHARMESMVASFFGWEEHVEYIKHDDELLAASALAKQQLPALQKAFTAGFQPGEYLEVKAPFKTESGGNEWMWVEVTKWQGNRIGGLLDNEPEHVPNLHTGQQVEIRQEDIFDYIHTFADKRSDGNTTGPIIERMHKTADAPKAPIVKPVIPACDSGDPHGSH
jgi:uncharacterized protein YegJ (DUF2314 family)